MRRKGLTGLCRIATALIAGAMLLMGTIAANADFVATLPFAQPTHPAGPAKPTAAWTQFCSQVPEECQIDLTEPALIQLTPLNWALLEIINQRINREIQPRTDQEHWGVVDRWDYPEDGYGDCEDYQLLKRKLLIAAGLPRRAMRMTVVLDKNGGGHAVLMILTSRGDFVLDNHTDAVLAWTETGYEFIKREGSDDLTWVGLGGSATRTVVATRSVRHH